MKPLALAFALIVSGAFLSASALGKSVRVQFQLFLPSNEWAAGAAGALEWTGGVDTSESDRHGLLTFAVPGSVKQATLSATLGIYCLPPTLVPISKSRPGSEPGFTLSVCQ